tara:strand:- start:1376 stop:2065 length:690 start_codon:yes stop_codon:yes gene_type:complete
VIGKTMLEVFPELRDHFTFPYYCEVARTGEAMTRPDPDYILITFVEVPETIRIMDALADLNHLSGTPVDLDAYICGAMEIGCRTFNATRAFQLNLRDQGYSVVRQYGQQQAAEMKKPLPMEVVRALGDKGRAAGIRNIFEEFELSAESQTELTYNSIIAAPFSVDSQNSGALVFCFTLARTREPTPSELKLVRTLSEAIAARIRFDAAAKAWNNEMKIGSALPASYRTI